MTDLSSFIKEDWAKIPSNYRYLFLFGLLLIFLTWLKDHWGNWHYNINNFDWGYITFYSGLMFILLGIVMAVVSAIMEQVLTSRKISKLRAKYPRESLGKKFDLITVTGKIYLTDKKKKYWIGNGTTYTDLNFFWGDEKKVSKGELNQYAEGPIIITRGTPGRN